jgi:hypothetical protein
LKKKNARDEENSSLRRLPISRGLERQDRFELAEMLICVAELLLRSSDLADSAVGAASGFSVEVKPTTESATNFLAPPDERPVLLNPLLQTLRTLVG